MPIICSEFSSQVRFIKEQSQKQADLKKKRSEHHKIQTVEAGVQCESHVVLKQMANASVQTVYYDVTGELNEQVRNLTEVVKQLTTLKCIHQHEPKTPNSALFEDDQFHPHKMFLFPSPNRFLRQGVS